MSSPYHVAATYPFWAARLVLLCVSLEVFATPTRRHHGRMLIHPSLPPCATPSHKGVSTHAGSGPSRVRRRLFGTCLGDPISWPPLGLFPLGLRVLDAFLSFCIRLCHFSTLIHIVANNLQEFFVHAVLSQDS